MFLYLRILWSSFFWGADLHISWPCIRSQRWPPFLHWVSQICFMALFATSWATHASDVCQPKWSARTAQWAQERSSDSTGTSANKPAPFPSPPHSCSTPCHPPLLQFLRRVVVSRACCHKKADTHHLWQWPAYSSARQILPSLECT